MNFFEKLKLKTTLRNCDYKLAGKVIRQQFYVQGRDAEINKLIDEYDLNPSFDAAVKLIDYNEMLVFYFTESCSGGLYIRKNGEQVSEEKVEPTKEMDLTVDPEIEIELESQGDPDLIVDDTIANRFSIHPTKMASKVVDPEKIQHLEESYNWMKDMISKQNTKPNSTQENEIKFDSAESEGNLELELDGIDISVDNEKTKQPHSTKRVPVVTDIEQINLAIDNDDEDMQTATLVIDTKKFNMALQNTAEKTEVEDNVVEIDLSTDSLATTEDEKEEVEYVKPKREIEVFYETAPLEDLPDWVNELDEETLSNVMKNKSKRPFDYLSTDQASDSEPLPISPTEPAKSLLTDIIGTNPPNMDTAPLKSILDEVKAVTEPTRIKPPVTFRTLISTIQMDIDTMRKQLNEYKRELRINPWDSDQLQNTIYALEDAIHEFNEAIRILNENKEA
jgi:hypothetical protein